MSLTPKETGGGSPSSVYPVDVSYSCRTTSLDSGALTVTGAVTIALSFKPMQQDASGIIPLPDPTNHYMCLISYDPDASRVGMYVNGINIGNNTSLTYTTISALLKDMMVWAFGAYQGYYSNLYVVDGEVGYWSWFFETSSKYGVHVWKKGISLNYGTKGGHYDFHDGSNLGADVSGNDNHWTIGSAQTLDTPTNNYTLLDPTNPKTSSTSSIMYGLMEVSATAGWKAAVMTYPIPRTGKWGFMATKVGDAVGGGSSYAWADVGPRPLSTVAASGAINTANWPMVIDCGWFKSQSTAIQITSAINAGDTIEYLIDMDALSMKIKHNGTLVHTEDISYFTERQLKEFYFGVNNYQGSVRRFNLDPGQLGYTPSEEGYLTLCSANLPEPEVDPSENFFIGSFTAVASTDQQITLPWDATGEKWVMQLSTAEGELMRWFDSERPGTDCLRHEAAVPVVNTGGVYISGSTMTIESELLTADRKYIVYLFRCNDDSPFDVQKVSHTTGTDTVFNHRCNAKPDWMFQKGITSGSDLVPYEYHSSKGVDQRFRQHLNYPWQSAPGEWANLGSSQSMINASHATGDYIVYLFAPPMTYSFMYTGNGSADGPVHCCGGTPVVLHTESNGYGQGWQTDPMRNPVNPFTGIQYLNGYTASHTRANMLYRRSSGYKLGSTFFNGTTVDHWDGVGILSHVFKYSNAVV